jgi:outer membrane protein
MFKYWTLIILSIFYFSNSYSITLNQAVEIGLQNSHEYIMELNRLKAAENANKSNISAYLPNISLNYQTGIKQDIRGDSDSNDDFGNETSENISLSQPIFNGFKSINNSNKSEFEFLAASKAFEYFERDLIYRIIESYIELQKWQKVKFFTKQNLNNYYVILKQIKSKASYGSNNELIDYKINFALAKQELRLIEKHLFDAELEFQNLVSSDFNELSDPDIELHHLELNLLLKDINSNPEAMQKHYEYLALLAENKILTGELLPKISLEASHTKQSNVVYLNGEDLETKSILLDVKIPLFNQGSRFFNIKEGRYNANIKAQEYELTLAKIKKEISSKYKEYNLHYNDYNQVFKIHKLIANKLAKNQKSYNLNLLDKVSLLKLKIDKNEAEIKFIESDSNLYKAYFKIKTLTEKGRFANIFLND